ncbi:hypothetical protein HQ586_03250 [Candidatus Bathyarchaeota archaeon]|nr:hypothetical protein [Candidatus Bathyarchaeota archaeon]
MKLKILALLLLLFTAVPMAFAWDPTTENLSGTDSSTTSLSDRFDIDSTTAGIQIGEDGESIAFLLVMNDFKLPGMTAEDQYQISFTIASTDFALVFRASASKAGVLTLFYKDTASSIWSTNEIYSTSNMKSGTAYRSVSGAVGVTLTSGTSVKLVVSKDCLYGLGGTETVVSQIFGATFELGDGTPGSSEATPNDRCPASGDTSFSLQQGIDDFPHGTAVLMVPVTGIYLVLRRRRKHYD